VISAIRRSISTHMSVPTTPGQYAFTVMPSDANSFADALAGTGDERDFPVDAHGTPL
jgi:hypothetical protein